MPGTNLHTLHTVVDEEIPADSVMNDSRHQALCTQQVRESSALHSAHAVARVRLGLKIKKERDDILG